MSEETPRYALRFRECLTSVGFKFSGGVKRQALPMVAYPIPC